MRTTSPSQNYQERIETWFYQRERLWFRSGIVLSIIIALLNFNARISEAHDDALYLEGGWRFVNEFPSYFYTQNAPLYPLFLALCIKLIGFKLILIKLSSVACHVGAFGLLFKALSKRVPVLVLIPVLIFQLSNSLIAYYSSMTFTEAAYFMLQSLWLYAWTKTWNNTSNPVAVWRWLLLGLSLFLLSTLKSSAIVVIPAMLFYYSIRKQYRNAAFALGAYVMIKGLYELAVKWVWNAPSQFAGQSKILLQKDPYDASLGQEDFHGFINRFLENANLSLSKRFYQLLHFKNENWNEDVNDLGERIFSNGSWFLTILTASLLIAGLFYAWRKQQWLVFGWGLFGIAQAVLSFLILQTRWDQPRITLVCMPSFLALIYFVLIVFWSKPGIKIFYTICFGLSFILGLNDLFSKTKTNIPIVIQNLKGNIYEGYTPDWQNFLKASTWCSDSLPKTALVASRKAPMSFVYGKGKRFFPVYSVVCKDSASNQSNPDSALAYFKKNKVTHVLLPHLRINPQVQGMGFINTVHNIIAPIALKYPNRLRLIHIEGYSDNENPGAYEECYVYAIQY